MESLNITYLWRDKKRVFGLPLCSQRYALSEDKIFIETGRINASARTIELTEISDLSVKTTFWQNVFKTGTVVVKLSNNEECRLEGVKQPMMVCELIRQYVEKLRDKRMYSI